MTDTRELVERYVMEVDSDFGDDAKCVPVSDPWGQWVRASDYDALSERASDYDALSERCRELEAAEDGFGNTLGSSAVGHLREMYPAAYDTLGTSGRRSLRNYINARAALASGGRG